MIRKLVIRNLAVVDDLQVGFNSGLNVITGETGTGKSLLVGALRLLLGERAGKAIIRTGEPFCSVLAEFLLADPSDADAVLAERGMDPCEGGVLIIRRVVTVQSSRQLVNDEPVTLNVLRQLGSALVDMHGPYDHQSLLNRAVQLQILDAFGSPCPARTGYGLAFDRCHAVQQRMEALQEIPEEERHRQMDLMAFRVHEIETAHLTVEEEDEVEREHGITADSQRIIELADRAAQALTEGEGCAFEALAVAQQALRKLAGLLPEAEEWSGEVEQAAMAVQEVVRAIEVSSGTDALLATLNALLAHRRKVWRRSISINWMLFLLVFSTGSW